MGRHRENDIPMPDTAISRFHARFTWDTKMDRPVVFDNGSQNGTTVDGRPVRTATPLSDGSRVTIGPYTLTVQLEGQTAGPAILKDTGDMVTLFSEDGESTEGMAGSPNELREALLLMERERRTGTMVLRLKGGARASVTFCLGRVMAADVPDGAGLRALERILTSPAATYRFSGAFEPIEDSLNLWVSDYLRSRNMDEGQATVRFKSPTSRLDKSS